MLSLYTFLGLCIVFPCQALTYYQDSSCAGKITGAVMDEVKSMASEGAARLRSGDTTMSSAFKLIFKVEKSNADAYNKAITLFDAIRGMTSATLKNSDVRFYCDNDGYGSGNRWQLIPDEPGAERPNSQRPLSSQRYWDPINQITRPKGNTGCQMESDILALTYYMKPKPDEATDQNPNRATISMCDAAFNEPSPKLLSDIQPDKDIPNSKMSDMDYFVSLTLFHELSHLPTTLYLPPGEEPYGWAEIVDLTASSALLAADSYTFLGLSAILNKRNVQISADPAAAKDGELVFITPPENPATPPGKPSSPKFKSRTESIFESFPYREGKRGVLFTA